MSRLRAKTLYTLNMESIVTEQSKRNLTEQHALSAARVASNHLAKDVLVLDISAVSGYNDYFLIVTGETERHLNFLAEHIAKELTSKGVRLDHREGDRDSGWVLLDFGDIVAHIFTAEQRQHYNLEALWEAGRVVLALE